MCILLQKSLSEKRPLISWRKIAFFVVGTLSVSVLVSQRVWAATVVIYTLQLLVQTRDLRCFFNFYIGMVDCLRRWCMTHKPSLVIHK